MIKTHVGIDPGKDSFICHISNDIVCFDRIPMIGTETNIWALNAIFCGIRLKETESEIHVVLEDVHSVFGSSAKSNWEFGKINGILEALLVANGMSYSKIQPKVWQKQLWEGVAMQKTLGSTGKEKTDTKKMSLLAAQRLFPSVDLRKSERAKLPDHNKVDALLLAEYCRRNF